MTVRALVVDDEKLAREELCFLLSRLDVTVVGQAGNGVEALEMIETLTPDLVLLDVQMPGMSGFDVTGHLVERGSSVEVIFVTAFDHYAIEAFNVNAVDYLLKPVDPSRLEQAIQRAERRLEAGRAGAGRANEELERLVKLVADRRGRPERLAVKVGERFLLIDVNDLVFATLTDETITVVASSHSGTSNYRTLDELQAQLDPAVFWRVHRSYLVNINKIKEIVPWFSRNYILKMSDGKATEVPVSRSQTRRLREYLRL